MECNTVNIYTLQHSSEHIITGNICRARTRDIVQFVPFNKYAHVSKVFLIKLNYIINIEYIYSCIEPEIFIFDLWKPLIFNTAQYNLVKRENWDFDQSSSKYIDTQHEDIYLR